VNDVHELVHVVLPTQFGEFRVTAFEVHPGLVYLTIAKGDLLGDGPVLTRLHSECLTGDVLGSLRCDCGVQLRQSLRRIATEGRGLLLYATGQEGRGIGLINKLRAYVEQDEGADTVDANVLLGLPVDSRDYTDAAAVLERLGVRTIRLLTNNPRKVAGLRAAGATVDEVVSVPTAPHHRNVGYLRTKAERMGHVRPTLAADSATETFLPADAMDLLGTVRARPDRPYVTLKYAQSLDGRIATATGDSKWISGEPERRVSHALRAACDAVLVGAGTAVRDDPELTVRLVSGASPTRVVLDSALRVPPSAKLFGPEAATLIVTTERSDEARRAELVERGVGVEVVAADRDRVDLGAALKRLRELGMESVLVEGGARVITGLLARGLVDRIVVAVAPIVIGAGTEAVEHLDVTRVSDGIHLANRTIVPVGDDVLLAWDVVPPR
jgi:3,4-dihydroxy 2-butanone 4-phosphate synthase/GTP cyclohydrolase II